MYTSTTLLLWFTLFICSGSTIKPANSVHNSFAVHPSKLSKIEKLSEGAQDKFKALNTDLIDQEEYLPCSDEFDALMNALYLSYLKGNAVVEDLWSLADFSINQCLTLNNPGKRKLEIADIQTALRAEQCMLSFYHQNGNSINPGRLFSFFVSRDKIRVNVQPDLGLNTLIRQYIAQVKKPPAIFHHKEELLFNLMAIDSLGWEIKNKLFRGINIQPYQEIILIPHREIANLPFSALPLKEMDIHSIQSWNDYPFLVKQKTITHSFSAKWWMEGMSKKKFRNGVMISGVDRNAFREHKLPLLEQSSHTISMHQAGNRFSTNVDIDFLYFGMHGSELHSSTEDESFLSSGFIFDDYPVRSTNIVLAGCRSAISGKESNRMVQSPCLAAAHQGAESIIASLWDVPDLSTSQIFQPLLLHPSQNCRNVSKLLNTYLFQKAGIENHPYHWAAWVHYAKKDKR